jgi:hypothetical protein
MRGARAHEANWSGGRGGDAAERQDGAAARPKNSGDGSKATGCTGSTTSDAGGCLTFLRVSWVASRRRKSGDGGGNRKRWWLGFRRLLS